MQKPDFLRKKHPRFVYKSYAYRLMGNHLRVVFDFRIEPAIRFKPEINIKNINKAMVEKVGEKAMNNFVFHLGLMEVLSYWKVTCSPEIMIKAGCLNKEQVNWWHGLIIKGMGQFFYENKIDWRAENFLKINCGRSDSPQSNSPQSKIWESDSHILFDSFLVPIGGGKDSIVTLEKLKERRKRINCFLVNPTQAAKNVLKIAGIKKPIIVERKIDPTLLKLNSKGYLNGHTPFTAVLSFLSVFCAVLFGYKNIAFSNEKSANEGNVKYLNKIINHQYSKSSEFEKKFRNYCKKYLAQSVNYFSFLRKYTELEIARMFTKYPKYFPVFSSCNVVRKVGERWCSNCPKCLFVYASLYSFLKKNQLMKIFGHDLFENKKLLPVMKDLIGRGRRKPFECVGTYQESRRAFELCIKMAQKSGKIPYLLQKLNEIR